MRRFFTQFLMVNVILVGLGAALVGCSSEDGAHSSDLGTAADFGSDQGIATIDSAVAVADSAVEPDSFQQGAYPAGPYGTSVGQVIFNHSFDAFLDPDNFCKKHSAKVMDLSKTQKISLNDWYYGRGCGKQKLLWISVVAGWCTYCIQEAREVMSWIRQNGLDERVAVAEIIYENGQRGSRFIDEAFAKTWINGNQTTFPLMIDRSFEMSKYFTASATPLNMLIDLSTMQIYYKQTGKSITAVGGQIKSYLLSGK
ncbi:MAG: redoxin domain-containing protein [Deltaproteobacteria bacterium]|nr:redoxin domain-containing protein [Deltaproteobacteria bacterium]